MKYFVTKIISGEYAIFEAHHECRESNAYCSSIVNNCICHCLNGYIAVGSHCLKGKNCREKYFNNSVFKLGIIYELYIHDFCWLANVTLGSVCVADQQCTGSPFSGVCSDGFCECQRGYIFIQDKCFPGIHYLFDKLANI